MHGNHATQKRRLRLLTPVADAHVQDAVLPVDKELNRHHVEHKIQQVTGQADIGHPAHSARVQTQSGSHWAL